MRPTELVGCKFFIFIRLGSLHMAYQKHFVSHYSECINQVMGGGAVGTVA